MTSLSLDSTSNHSTSLDSTSNHSASSFTYGGCVLFPWKLHEMLDAAEERQFTSVVSWLPDCRSFKVHDKETFVSLIMPQFFEQTRYKSFQRQLNMWGFERIVEKGPEKGGYNHPAGYFVRGESSLCTRMTRLKKKKKMNTTTANTTTTATTAASSSKSIAIVHSNQSSSSSSEGIIKGVMRRASRASLVFTKVLCDQLEAFDRYVSGGGGGDNDNDYEQDLTTTHDDNDNTPYDHHHYHHDNDNDYIEPEPYQYQQQGTTTRTRTSSSSVSSAGRGLLRRASRASVVITKALHDQLEALDDFMTTPSPEDDAELEFHDYIIATTDHPPMVRRITEYDTTSGGDEDNSSGAEDENGSVEEFAGQNFFMVDDDEGPELRRLSSIGKRIFLHHSRVSSS